MKTWYCFRELTTGRWQADTGGQQWCNLPEHAYRFFRITDLIWCWAVLEEPDYVAIWADPPRDPPPALTGFERIMAKAHKFCSMSAAERAEVRKYQRC